MKCKMIGVCDTLGEKMSSLRSIPLLAMRLVLAYGFIEPGLMKWKNIDAIGKWFDSMGYPIPLFNAYMAATTEVVGAILLLLGFGVRLITIPLMVVMLVAIFTVHATNGFQAGNNGFEIPVYYLIMLLTLLIYGSGNFSIESIIRKYSKS
jgi:putative oxidoreductase